MLENATRLMCSLYLKRGNDDYAVRASQLVDRLLNKEGVVKNV